MEQHPGWVGVVVAVDDEHADRVSEVADRLRAEGMEVDDVLALSATVAGSAAETSLDRLRGLEGVAAVEVARWYRPLDVEGGGPPAGG